MGPKQSELTSENEKGKKGFHSKEMRTLGVAEAEPAATLQPTTLLGKEP